MQGSHCQAGERAWGGMSGTAPPGPPHPPPPGAQAPSQGGRHHTRTAAALPAKQRSRAHTPFSHVVIKLQLGVLDGLGHATKRAIHVLGVLHGSFHLHGASSMRARKEARMLPCRGSKHTVQCGGAGTTPHAFEGGGVGPGGRRQQTAPPPRGQEPTGGRPGTPRACQRVPPRPLPQPTSSFSTLRLG
jgi:hypothetical protein